MLYAVSSFFTLCQSNKKYLSFKSNELIALHFQNEYRQVFLTQFQFVLSKYKTVPREVNTKFPSQPSFLAIQGLKFSGANIFCHSKCDLLCEIERIQFGLTDLMSEFKRKLGSEIEVKKETWNNCNGLNFSFVHSYTKNTPLLPLWWKTCTNILLRS